MPETLAKLMIKVVDEKAKLQGEWYAHFNPKEYALAKSVPWNPQNSSGVDAPPLQFTSGQGETLDLELFFDTLEDSGKPLDGAIAVVGGAPVSVTTLTSNFRRLAQIDEELHCPPRVLVSWGELKFYGVVESVNQRFTMFLSSGVPVRATVTMKLREAYDAKYQEQERPKNSPDHAKLHVVHRGETLQSIAANEYDNPGEWRRIADANGIDDPFRLEPGRRLLVPPILN